MASLFHDGFPFNRRRREREPAPARPGPAMRLAQSPAGPDEDPDDPRPTPPAVLPVPTITPTATHPMRLAATPPTRRAERRRSPRQTLVAKATIRPDGSVPVAALVSTGFVSNISLSGIGFHTRKPLAIGEKYRLSLELGPMKWATRLRVVTCEHHPKSGTFDIGAEFVGNDLMSRPRSLAA